VRVTQNAWFACASWIIGSRPKFRFTSSFSGLRTPDHLTSVEQLRWPRGRCRLSRRSRRCDAPTLRPEAAVAVPRGQPVFCMKTPRVHRAACSEHRSVTWLRWLNAPTAGLCMKLDTTKLPLTIRVRRSAKFVGNIWLRRKAQASHTTNSSGCRMARMFDRASLKVTSQH
jgi:hypothetical protein